LAVVRPRFLAFLFIDPFSTIGFHVAGDATVITISHELPFAGFLTFGKVGLDTRDIGTC
jgi:hypothetical protein